MIYNLSWNDRWKQKKIEDVVKRVKVGYVGSCQKDYCDANDGIPMIRTTNLTDNGITLNDLKYVTKSFHEKNQKSQLKKNDILIARHGENGKACIFDKYLEANCLNVVIIEPDESKALPYFIKYIFDFDMVKQQIQGLTVGSVQSVINTKTIAKLIVGIPSIAEQKRIVDILGKIDAKIAINTAINENLEQQAQALFKAWFVAYEPFGGVMPDDWRMGTLSEICGYSKDKVDIDDLTLDTYYSTENMQPNRQGAVQATTLPTIKQTTACKKGDVLISNIRPYFKKILYCFSDCGCSTDVLCFVPNQADYSVFLYCALYADKFFDYMVAGSKGTKMPRGDKQQIMVYPICIPSSEYIEKFNQAVAPMLETVYTNRIEANNLANLRDTLLPKLMNGEIDVSEVKV